MARKHINEERRESFCMYCANAEDRLPASQSAFNTHTCGDVTCLCGWVRMGCRAHPLYGMLAEYCKEHGVLTLVCTQCGQVAEIVAVAEEVKLNSDGTPKGSWTPALQK